MRVTRRSMLAVTTGMALTRSHPIRAADGYPTAGKPVVIIVPYEPGGSTDTSARLMARALEGEIGGVVQVLNRPGAGSQIGVTEMVRAAPDGYTLLWAVLPTIITQYLDPSRHAIYTRQNFQAVGMHHFSPVVFAVSASSSFHSMRDLVEAARAKPEAITVSDSGIMATPHVGVLLLLQATGVRFTSVHYAGGTPSANALLGGHVDAVAGGAADVLSSWQSGAFRVLGTAAEVPDPLLPGIPTLREQGFDVVVASASGLLAPQGTSMPVVVTLAQAMHRILMRPTHREALVRFGITPTYLGPDDYGTYWARDEARMRPLMAGLVQK